MANIFKDENKNNIKFVPCVSFVTSLTLMCVVNVDKMFAFKVIILHSKYKVINHLKETIQDFLFKLKTVENLLKRDNDNFILFFF